MRSPEAGTFVTMRNPEVGMFVNIVSPRSRVTVGPDRRLTVSIDAWGVILTGGGGGGHGGGGGIPGGGGVLPQSGVEIEPGQVLVKLGDGDFGEAIKVPSPHLPRRWRFRGAADGGGPLRITVRSLPPPGFQGQTASATRTVEVVIDNIPPDISIDQLPSARRVHEIEVSSGSTIDLTLTGSATDSSGVRSVHVGVGEASEQAENVSGDWEEWKHTLRLRGFRRHDLRVKAVDRHGNRRTERRRVETIDTGLPRLSFTSPRRGEPIGWPEDGELTVEFRGTASDSGTGVRWVGWRLGDEGQFEDAEDLSDADSPGEWSEWRARVPIPGLGEHAIHFLCRDRAGNEVREEFPLRAADLTPPELRITRPSHSPHEVLEEEGGVTVEVRGKAEDAVTEVAAVEWSLEGSEPELVEALEDDWSEWRFSVNLSERGDHAIEVRATDASGNSSARELIVRVMERV